MDASDGSDFTRGRHDDDRDVIPDGPLFPELFGAPGDDDEEITEIRSAPASPPTPAPAPGRPAGPPDGDRVPPPIPFPATPRRDLFGDPEGPADDVATPFDELYTTTSPAASASRRAPRGPDAAAPEPGLSPSARVQRRSRADRRRKRRNARLRGLAALVVLILLFSLLVYGVSQLVSCGGDEASPAPSPTPKKSKTKSPTTSLDGPALYARLTLPLLHSPTAA